MKVTGKLTKTEWLILALTAVFLAVLALLYLDASRTAEGTDYTISTQRRTQEPVTPAPPPPKEPVDVNTADAEELQTLANIGPALAQRIIDYREANGPFRSVEDLLEVKGIGEATLEKFREDVTLGGAADREEDATGEEEAAA